MPETNRTKRAIAGAFKDLLKEVPFSKITVAEICKRSGISRKSFYYHFIDKYDLVNWIFDTERPAAMEDVVHYSDAERLSILSRYFYDNREFYRAVLQYKGQNCLTEHLEDLAGNLLQGLQADDVSAEPAKAEQQGMVTRFFSDALLAALDRWMQDHVPMKPEDFVEYIKLCVRIMNCEEWNGTGN